MVGKMELMMPMRVRFWKLVRSTLLYLPLWRPVYPGSCIGQLKADWMYPVWSFIDGRCFETPKEKKPWWKRWMRM